MCALLPPCDWDILPFLHRQIHADGGSFQSCEIMRNCCTKRSHKELHLKFVSHGGGEYRRTGAFPCSFSHCVFWQSSKHHSNCVFVHVWVTVHHPAELGMEAICLTVYLHCWSSAPIDFISNTDCDHFLCAPLAGGWTTRKRDFASFFFSVSSQLPNLWN